MLDAGKQTGFNHPDDLLQGCHLVFWADVAARLQDTAAAALLRPKLDVATPTFFHTGTIGYGAFAHSRGIVAATLGDLDSAAIELRSALDVHEGLGAPFFSARSCLELGRVLLRRGARDDLDRADELLTRAADLAERYGCEVVADDVRAARAGES